jgi:hypothetical protein
VERMDDLTRVTSRLAERNNELVDATAAGDSGEIAALLRDISALERRRNELVRRVAADTAPQRYETAIPVRDRVIQALSLGGRAMAAKLLADLARSFYGATIPTQSLSSLRRDERRSFLSAQDDFSRTAERDVYVVPALTFDRFTPVRGTLALSSWPTEHRLIAPSSPRVDVLQITIRLVQQLPVAVDPSSARRLVMRLARTIPGALPSRIAAAGSSFPASLPTGEFDANRIVNAAEGELTQLAERDETERADAADRAHAYLSAEALLFGTAVTLAHASARRAQ